MSRRRHVSEWCAWRDMRRRCTDPATACYEGYGGRGITVCDRWLESFENFLADMGPKPTPRHSIDRENNNGNYEPSNCRWAVTLVQNNNKRNNRVLEHNGQRKTAAEWARGLGGCRHLVTHRISRHGWTIAEAVTTPIGQRRPA